MWALQSDWYEIVFRAFAIFVVLFILFRALGRKQIGEMSPFDLVLLLIISESVSNSIVGEDHSLTAGLMSATTLLLLSAAVNFLAYKSRRVEKVIEGEPIVLIQDGKLMESVLSKFTL